MVHQKKNALFLLVLMEFILNCNAQKELCIEGTVHHALDTGQDVCCVPVASCPAGHEIKFCSTRSIKDTCQPCPPGTEQHNETDSFSPTPCQPIRCDEGVCTSPKSVSVNTAENSEVSDSSDSSGSSDQNSNALWSLIILIFIIPAGILIFVLYKRKKLCFAAKGNSDDAEKGLDEYEEMEPLVVEANLYRASKDGDDEKVKNLLRISDEKGMKLSLDGRNEDGQTPLHLAAAGGHITVMEILLDSGARADIQDDSGWTPLQYAACSLKIENELSESQDNEKARRVMQMLAEKSDINFRDKNGKTPLLLTVTKEVRQNKSDSVFIDRKLLNIAAILIQCDADVQLRDKDDNGDTFFHRLVDRKCGRALASDLDKFFEVSSEKQVDVNATNKRGQTPLHVVFDRGEFGDERLDIVRAVNGLMKCDADVSARDNASFTIFHCLAECQLSHSLKKDDGPEGKMIDSLLQKGRDVLNHKEKTGLTPLQRAIYYGNLYFVEKLLECDCDVNTTNNNDATALHHLAEDFSGKIEKKIDEAEEMKEIVESLVKKSTTVINSRNKRGTSPVHVAFREKKFNIADILIRHGCDVTVKNNQGETVLHILVDKIPYKPNKETQEKIESLLEKCVSVIKTTNQSGEPPIALARKRGLSWFVDILERHGGNVTE